MAVGGKPFIFVVPEVVDDVLDTCCGFDIAVVVDDEDVETDVVELFANDIGLLLPVV